METWESGRVGVYANRGAASYCGFQLTMMPIGETASSVVTLIRKRPSAATSYCGTRFPTVLLHGPVPTRIRNKATACPGEPSLPMGTAITLASGER